MIIVNKVVDVERRYKAGNFGEHEKKIYSEKFK